MNRLLEADQLWPEIPWPGHVPTNTGALACLAEQGGRPVWAEGNPAGQIMIILDNPGAREDKEGRPFTCGTRLTLQQAAAAAGLDARDLYVTYLLKRRPRRAYDHPLAWRTYLPLLRRQIMELAPHVLVCLGNTVVQALWGPGQEVKRRRGERLGFAGVPALVSYHPLAARRRPGLFPLLVQDLARARSLLSPQSPSRPTTPVAPRWG